MPKPGGWVGVNQAKREKYCRKGGKAEHMQAQQLERATGQSASAIFHLLCDTIRFKTIPLFYVPLGEKCQSNHDIWFSNHLGF